jgi:two-component system sensor histidine kinase MprB
VTFRTRLILLAALAVAAAVLAASVSSFLLVRSVLRSRVDDALRERAGEVQLQTSPEGGVAFTIPSPELGGAPGYVQLVPADGNIPIDGALPVDVTDRQIASGARQEQFRDARVAGVHVRIYTAYVGPGMAVEVARPLDEVDAALRRLAYILGALAVLGVVSAGALGRLVSRAALAPVRRLSETSRHVASTHDLTRRIDVVGSDELAGLAENFNAMLAALERSIDAQRQLVADASHELRTPLTALRTNVEILERQELPAEARPRFARVVGQLDELTALVGDIVELARGSEPPQDVEEVALDELVDCAVERARALAPRVDLVTEFEPTVVRGVREQLDRAVWNLLDNACKWSRDGSAVEVTVRVGAVVVRDHGPGIDDADLPHVFDRFYRSAAARGMPGSGLGLAIVRQIAESHGGSVVAERAPGGGARFVLRLPPVAARASSGTR